MCMLCSCTFNGENADSNRESGVMDDSRSEERRVGKEC